jgi:hypothetical protein
MASAKTIVLITGKQRYLRLSTYVLTTKQVPTQALDTALQEVLQLHRQIIISYSAAAILSEAKRLFRICSSNTQMAPSL